MRFKCTLKLSSRTDYKHCHDSGRNAYILCVLMPCDNTNKNKTNFQFIQITFNSTWNYYNVVNLESNGICNSKFTFSKLSFLSLY